MGQKDKFHKTEEKPKEDVHKRNSGCRPKNLDRQSENDANVALNLDPSRYGKFPMRHLSENGFGAQQKQRPSEIRRGSSITHALKYTNF